MVSSVVILVQDILQTSLLQSKCNSSSSSPCARVDLFHVDLSRSESLLNLAQGFVAVVEEVLGFARVDARDSKEELSTETESHGQESLSQDGRDGGRD